MSYKSGIINNLISNTLEITFPDEDCETITEANIVSESMELRQAISDGDELRFGGCIASEFTIDILKTYDAENDAEFPNVDLTGKWIAVKLTQTYADPETPVYPSSALYPSGGLFPGKTIGNKEFWIFSGYIDSAKVNKNDKNIITVTAYDALAKLYEADATDWFYNHNGIILTDFSAALYNQLVSLGLSCDYGTFLSEQYTVGGVTKSVGAFAVDNTYWKERKDKVTYGGLLGQMCELLAVFGVVRANSGKGQLKLIDLGSSVETYGFYESLETEDYMSTGYTKYRFAVRNSNTDPRPGKSVEGALENAVAGSVDKFYDFSDNILILQPCTTSGQGRTSTDFDLLINNSSINKRVALWTNTPSRFSSFQPLSAALDGRLWVSTGDSIEILVNKTTLDGSYVYDENDEIVKESVKTYVLSRTMTGIQALTDKIEVKGAR